MRKSVLFTFIAVIVALVTGGAILYQQYAKKSADLADMKVAEESARLHYAEAFNAIAEIQDSLSAISVGEGATKMVPQSLSAEQKLTEPNRAEVLESIALLQASIQRTKDKIGHLESNLQKSGAKIAGLQHMIVRLKESVAEKEMQIASLTGEVDSLNTRVAGLETTVHENETAIQAKDQTIEEKRRELGTIYYVIGTQKELTAQGLIAPKGGLLGLGKTLQLTGTYDESKFTALDTDRESVVIAPSTKVRVLSPQPLSSYELKVEGTQVQLHILDAKEFRKVKHLVIMTA